MDIGSKRSNTGYGESMGQEKKLRGELTTTTTTTMTPTLRLLVKTVYAGAIIGKGAENLNRLRRLYPTAELNLLKSRAHEQVLQLNGLLEACLALVKEVIPVCPSARYSASATNNTFEVNLLE